MIVMLTWQLRCDEIGASFTSCESNISPPINFQPLVIYLIIFY